MKRRQKTGFLGSISSKITLTKEKRKEKKKERRERKKKKEKKKKKTVVALLVFITAALAKKKIKKKLLVGNGPFGGNVFKNPDRYIITKMPHRKYCILMSSRQ